MGSKTIQRSPAFPPVLTSYKLLEIERIVHAGLLQARAIVRNKAGKKVEFGLPYLLSRLGGGYVFGTLICGVVDESKMRLQALAGYRAIFGAQATPVVVVYDRGGYATATIRALA